MGGNNNNNNNNNQYNEQQQNDGGGYNSNYNDSSEYVDDTGHRPTGPLGIDPLHFSIAMFALLVIFVMYLLLPRGVRKQYFGAYPKRHAWSTRTRNSSSNGNTIYHNNSSTQQQQRMLQQQQQRNLPSQQSLYGQVCSLAVLLNLLLAYALRNLSF
jgi:hypothetical protein